MLDEIVKYLQSEYDVEEVLFPKSFSADGVTIGNPPYEPWHKPEFLYVTLNFCSEKSWTNEGGHNYCNLYLKDNSKILIYWNTSSAYKETEEFSVKFIRKLKLKKLDESR